MKFDLSKIKFPEIPTEQFKKTIFNDVELELTLKPLTGFNLAKLVSAKQDDYGEEISRLCLKEGAGFSDEEINTLINFEIPTVAEIVDRVVDLTRQFAETVAKEKETSKKNLRMKKLHYILIFR